jgi:DNA repair protein RadC
MSKPATTFSEQPQLGFDPLGDVIDPYDRGTPDFTKGHRKRLKERFMRAGTAGLNDYELLELVLFLAIPQGDVKPTAKRLLAQFGDLNRIISARPSLLMDVKGVGEGVVHALKIVEAAAHSLAQAKILHTDVLSSWSALMSYCKTAMAHRETEQFRILFLDRKNVLIADEEQQKGTVDHVPVYPREVAKRALELNASAVILVHNHPSGNPEPSQTDIDMTILVEQALQAVGVTVHDHVIIGAATDASFRAMGLL